MPDLIGCTFTKGQGWRAIKRLTTPRTLVQHRVAAKDGVLWIATDQTPRVGRYVNPAELLRNDPFTQEV